MTANRSSALTAVLNWLQLRFSGHRDVGLLGLALALGLVSAYASVVFRFAVDWLERNVVFLLADPAAVSWWWPMLTLTSGGLVIGIVIAAFARDQRAEGVADVIDAYVRPNRRLTLRQGLLHAAISAGSIGAGASVGREGPVVHLGASVANWLGDAMRMGRETTRILLGCGVAAAVAASFNAPIAGVFFALEVVIGNYALRAFAPIVIASVAGTMVSRAHFGDFPAFVVPAEEIVSLWEFPAFALLGAGAALIAVGFVRSTAKVRDLIAATPLPIWSRPAVGGLAVGLIAIVAPQVLGVGYASTDAALQGSLTLDLLILLLFAKFAATALSIGCGFGGGVFSPSLFVGAMYGGGFGLIAAQVFPELASSHGVYALVGTTAVAGAVLGAPISTILMVFELTGSYPVTAAMMVATVVGGVVQFELKGRSWFHDQLHKRGRDISGDRVALVTEGMTVRSLMRANPPVVAVDAKLEEVRDRLPFAQGGQIYVVDGDGALCGTVQLETIDDLMDLIGDEDHEDGALTAKDIAVRDLPRVTPDMSLDEARRQLEESNAQRLPVVAGNGSQQLVGVLDARDVLRAMHRALRDRLTDRV